MARLFITIVCALIATLLIAFYSVQRTADSLYYKYSADFLADLHRGTFDLLDDAIAGQHGADLKSELVSISNQFKYPVSLENRDDLDVPGEGLAMLANGEIYFYYRGDSSSIHRASRQTSGIWSIAIDLSVYDDNVASATGPFNLVRDRLVDKDPAALAREMARLQRSYGIPLALRTLGELDLTTREISRLNKGQIVARNPGENGEQYFALLEENGLVFRAGPIGYPASIGRLQGVLLVLFAAVMLVGCLLWIWPLWRDLQLLRRAAVGIGEGKLETRVGTRLPSLIRPVLDGFNLMAVRTQNMVASQRELTSAVSHELRTPLARMMFDLEMARQADNKHDQTRHLDSLEYGVSELNTLVDELLTYARQEQVESMLEFEAFSGPDMHDWLRSQVARARRSREGACPIDIKVSATGTEFIHFNPGLMAHAVSNTLQNALRFAASNIEVQLERQQDEWVLGIEDDGIGIPADRYECVFEPFTRLDESRQRDSGGFGLGLSIVRKIANWHQGDARIVAPRSLSGTRLEIHWPVVSDEPSQ